MNIRKAVTKGLLATAIAGALAIVPMALSTGTANADTRELGRDRPVRVGRQLVHQHRQRPLRRPAVQAGHLVLQRRCGQPGDRLSRGADPRRRERPAHPGAEGVAEVRRPGRQPGRVDHARHADGADRDDRLCRHALQRACSVSSTRARCAPHCSARWARWGPALNSLPCGSTPHAVVERRRAPSTATDSGPPARRPPGRTSR